MKMMILPFINSETVVGTLEGIDEKTLFRTFTSAFSDYAIRLDLSFARFQYMLRSNSFSPQLSAGAFRGRKLVGLVLNGVRRYEGLPTVYDSGTGVMPRYRNRGICSDMFGMLLGRLNSAGIRQYLLEVLKSNTAALHVYEKLGFHINREFACFKARRTQVTVRPCRPVESMPVAQILSDPYCRSFGDFIPAWQNSPEQIVSAANSVGAAVRDGGIVRGVGILNSMTGALHLLAVDRRCREEGIASSILAALLPYSLSENISVLNVDTRCTDMMGFLDRRGFSRTSGQYEMTRPLGIDG